MKQKLGLDCIRINWLCQMTHIASLRRDARRLLCLISLPVCVLLTACDFTTREEHIENYGKALGGEREMTQTDYIIHWPSLYKKEYKCNQDLTSAHIERKDLPPLAAPLTLKIPKEYLGVMELSAAPYIRNKEGKMINIRVISAIPGPKPWTQPFPWAKNPLEPLSKEQRDPEIIGKRRAVYDEAIRNSVHIFINRETAFKLHPPHVYGLAVGQYKLNKFASYMRESDLDGLQRYVGLICSGSGRFPGKIIEDKLKLKAIDDKSPRNCFTDQGNQILVTPPDTPESEQVEIVCGEYDCMAEISFISP